MSVSQLLFDGGAAGGQVRRFQARSEGAAFASANTAENVALRTGQNFIDVYRLREQINIAPAAPSIGLVPARRHRALTL